jgi:hypothetical protein
LEFDILRAIFLSTTPDPQRPQKAKYLNSHWKLSLDSLEFIVNHLFHFGAALSSVRAQDWPANQGNVLRDKPSITGKFLAADVVDLRNP